MEQQDAEDYYHEKLGDNPLYIELVTKHRKLYSAVLENGGVIFLPKIDQLGESVINKELVQAHCFSESTYVRGKYDSYPVVGGPARVVTMKGTTLMIGKGFEHSGQAKCIFEEGLDTGKGKIGIDTNILVKQHSSTQRSTHHR